MSGRSIDTCHKTRIENCKGSLALPREAYDKWAYWCKDDKSWRPLPCAHQSVRVHKGTQRVGDVEVVSSVVVPTTELEKMANVRTESQKVGAFIDWAQAQGYALCTFDDDTERYYPLGRSIEAILAEYYGIDLNAIENERRALLEAIRRPS